MADKQAPNQNHPTKKKSTTKGPMKKHEGGPLRDTRPQKKATRGKQSDKFEQAGGKGKVSVTSGKKKKLPSGGKGE